MIFSYVSSVLKINREEGTGTTDEGQVLVTIKVVTRTQCHMVEMGITSLMEKSHIKGVFVLRAHYRVILSLNVGIHNRGQTQVPNTTILLNMLIKPVKRFRKFI